MGVARPKDVPKTDEQRAAAAALTRAARTVKKDQEKLWALVADARRVGLSPTLIAELIGMTRDTVYRHLKAQDGTQLDE